MNFKVVNTLDIPGKNMGYELLKTFDVELIKGIWHTEEDFIKYGADADAILADISRKPFTKKVIDALDKCRIIAGVGLGFESIALEEATHKNIVVTNVPDYCLDEVSGRVMGLILALGYKLVQISQSVKARQLNMVKDLNSMLEVAAPIGRMRNKTLGIIGISKIGTATALKARGLGMKVIAYDPYVFAGAIASLGVEPVDLETVLNTSDFITIHVPLTNETRNLIGYEEFKKMKPSCFFINTARGGCVDENALIRALQEKLIAGAGIDVTANEPVEADNPLIEMDNVLLTGHSAWYSTEAEEELFYKPMTQVVLALQGKWPPYAINPIVKNQWLNKWK